MNLWYFIYIWLVILKFIQSNNHAKIHSFRLPNTVIPVRYLLQICSLLQNDNFKQISYVQIHIHCITPTNKITLHSRKLEIKKVILTDVNNDPLTIQKYTLEHKYDFLHIYLEEDLVRDRSYFVNINFTGKISDGISGYYRNSYKDESGNTKWITITKFEPSNARAAFPCFDEPALRAYFTIRLGRKGPLKAISNMPLSSTWEGKREVWDTYQESVKMPTYLVAYTINDFEFKTILKTNPYGNTTINIWARKHSLKQVKFALEISPGVLSFFEEYFDIAYPLAKLDILAIPDFDSASMENWGLITYNEDKLLHVSTHDKSKIAHNIAHEIAHNWVGNLVTIKWWTHFWLKEGFTKYLAKVAVEHLLPEINTYVIKTLINNMQNVYTVDGLATSRPVSIPIDNPDMLSEIHDSITYFKGSCIIRMLELFLGSKVLKKGLTHYLNKYKYDSIESDDLWNLLNLVAHEDESLPENLSVKTIMDTWTIQAGYPLVTVTRDYTEGTVTVSQNRFLQSVNTHDDTCYWVPLTYTTKKENDFNSTKTKRWLPCPKENITFELDKSDSDSWILFNIEASALYRVNYDHTNWKMLIKQLESDYKQIGTINRILLIDDVMQLAMTGHVDFQIAFDLIRYIPHDNHIVAWFRALRNLFGISHYMDRTSQYGLIKTYISNIVSPIFHTFGDIELLEFSEFKVLIMTTACSTDNKKCNQAAAHLYEKWRRNYGEYIIPVRIRKLIYCLGVKYGKEEEWNFLWQEYLKTHAASEKKMILEALACSQIEWILTRYLKLMIEENSDIRPQDAIIVFSSVIENKAGSFAARSFFYEYVNQIYEIQKPPKGKHMRLYVHAIAMSLRIKREFDEFTTYLETHEEYFKMTHITMKQMLERFEVWKYWHENFFPKIVEVLEKENNRGDTSLVR